MFNDMEMTNFTCKMKSSFMKIDEIPEIDEIFQKLMEYIRNG
jgi:hypothetical protein